MNNGEFHLVIGQMYADLNELKEICEGLFNLRAEKSLKMVV